MNVYVLKDCDRYDQEEVHAVFASQAAARKAAPSDRRGLRWQWRKVADGWWKTIPIPGDFHHDGLEIVRFEVRQ